MEVGLPSSAISQITVPTVAGTRGVVEVEVEVVGMAAGDALTTPAVMDRPPH